MRIANYCPACGHALRREPIHGQERPICPACAHIVYFDPKVAVVVFIQQDEQVLLVRRRYEPGQGKWALPAGFVEWNEAPEEAAIREVQEETGLCVVIERLLDVFPRRDHGLADIVIAYAACITGGRLSAGDDAEEVAWYRRDNLPELVFYPSQTLVGERWRRGEL